jgi:hypothetical protein
MSHFGDVDVGKSEVNSSVVYCPALDTHFLMRAAGC